jgi:hypothetical protein
MYEIYQSATDVHVWLGPDNKKHYAKIAFNTIQAISNVVLQTLGITLLDLSLKRDVYQEVVFKNRESLPSLSECEFVTDEMWKALAWLYSHPYFTRVWVIQELNARREPKVHCGFESSEWLRVEVVAGYIIVEASFSKKFGFSNAYCWWAAVATTERFMQPDDWVSMLYLASNFSSSDARDAIYGLLGLMKTGKAGCLLKPDYDKSMLEVYRDAVEEAFSRFNNTNVLLYVTGNENPSWIPRWDKAMIFRNPFRFGKTLPWSSGGDTEPLLRIDLSLNVLFISGIIVDSMELVEDYNEALFCDSSVKSSEGRDKLKQVWQRILDTLKTASPEMPFKADLLTQVAAAFSFGVDEEGNPMDESTLLHNFIAYLKIVFDEDTLLSYIAPAVSDESKGGNGYTFGKPVWDFEYPDSGFFITKRGLIGCSVSTTEPGDVVFAPLGSVYPLVLRPVNDGFTLRGYSYVHGIMRGEQRHLPKTVCKVY